MERLFNCESINREAAYNRLLQLSDKKYGGKKQVRARRETDIYKDLYNNDGDIQHEYENKYKKEYDEEDEEDEEGEEDEEDEEDEDDEEDEEDDDYDDNERKKIRMENKYIHYTELYKKYKEKHNCAHTHNKLPVHAYSYPQNVQVQKFQDLKDELVKEKLAEKKEKEKSRKKDKTQKAERKRKKENDEKIYHAADLKIYTPNDHFLKHGKKTLREKIYSGEVMFYDDYIEQMAAVDYERFFKKPYKVKRQDEGGKYFFFGKKLVMTREEDIYRKYYNLDDEYFVNKLKLINEAKKKEIERAKETKALEEKQRDTGFFDEGYKRLNYRDRSYLLKVEMENEKKNLNTYGFYKKNKNIVFNKNLPEFKKKELINGKIPDIILPITVRKKKHPQYCTVPFNRLEIYAISLEALGISPHIYAGIDEELRKNWKTTENSNMYKLRPERPKKGYKKDIYVVTKEDLEKSKQKFKVLIEKDEKANEENENISFKKINTVKFQKKEREHVVVSGGRYEV